MRASRLTTTMAALMVAVVLAGACTGGSDDDAVAVPEIDRPTPAPTVTPRPEPRTDPSGRLVPTPGPPARPDVADPAAELAEVGEVVVEMIDAPEPTPTPSGIVIPTPTATPPVDDPDPTPADGAEPADEAADPDEIVPLPTATGPDGPPVRVAGVVTATVGPLQVAAGACTGARARFERANRDLELDRPVRFVECLDDHGDPERNRALIERLTDDGRIFAVVPATSLAMFADDVLTSRHVPYVGVGDLPAYCGLDRGFGLGISGALGCPALAAAATPVVSVPHLELYALATGTDPDGLKMALVRSDTIAGELLSASVALQAELLGAEVVLDSSGIPGPAEAARTRWDALADEIVDSDADMVLIDGDDRTVGLYAALRSRYDGDVVGTAFTDPLPLVDDPEMLTALAGSYQISQGYDAAATGAGWDRFVADARAIGVGEADLGHHELGGYVAADLLVAALAATGDPLSPEALHNVVNNGWQYPGIAGLACAGWWPASHVVAFPCGAVAEVNPLEGPLRSVVPLTEFDLIVRTPGER